MITQEQLLAAAEQGRVYYVGPEPHLVPATLADFECEHGRIGDCAACDRERGLLVAGRSSRP